MHPADVQPTDDYTMVGRLCDDEGIVSHARVEPPNAFTPDLTYYEQLNNLRQHGGHAPYEGEPFACTGSAHLAGEHILCTSPAHKQPTASLDQPLRAGGVIVVGDVRYVTSDQLDHLLRVEAAARRVVEADSLRSPDDCLAAAQRSYVAVEALKGLLNAR